MKKVLILYSWNDFTSRNRFRIMSESQLLKDFEIRQCFALASPEEKLNPDKFRKKLCADIKSFMPDILLVHAGIAFISFPNIFIETLEKVKKTYPKTMIGVEEHQVLVHYYSDKKIFENSKEMRAIARMFFHDVFRD